MQQVINVKTQVISATPTFSLHNYVRQVTADSIALAVVSDLEARLNNFQAQIIRNMGRNQDLPV